MAKQETKRETTNRLRAKGDGKPHEWVCLKCKGETVRVEPGCGHCGSVNVYRRADAMSKALAELYLQYGRGGDAHLQAEGE